MAKLEGVKTIDTTNGEITKVSYNGAEYAKVSGEAFDTKTGDLILRTDKSERWASVGDFFEVVDGRKHVDNEGDYENCYPFLFATFRKTRVDSQ